MNVQNIRNLVELTFNLDGSLGKAQAASLAFLNTPAANLIKDEVMIAWGMLQGSDNLTEKGVVESLLAGFPSRKQFNLAEGKNNGGVLPGHVLTSAQFYDNHFKGWSEDTCLHLWSTINQLAQGKMPKETILAKLAELSEHVFSSEDMNVFATLQEKEKTSLNVKRWLENLGLEGVFVLRENTATGKTVDKALAKTAYTSISKLLPVIGKISDLKEEGVVLAVTTAKSDDIFAETVSTYQITIAVKSDFEFPAMPMASDTVATV
jgi:hypothetical protein